MSYKFSKSSIKNLKNVHPMMVQLMMECIKDSPYDFGIDSGVRTTEEQKSLYAKGRTEPGTIVTGCDGVVKISNHQEKSDGFGHAVDILVYVDKKVTWEHKYFKEVADYILSKAKERDIPIKWGGNFKRVDSPHFELSL